MCIEMFPKNRINIIYRLLCLICYIGVIIITKSNTTLIVLFIAYALFGLSEKCFRNIAFVFISLLILLMCYLLNNYLLLRIILLIEYIFYFIDTSYYYEEIEDTKISQKEYLRFIKLNKKKKKGSSNITALYLTVHLVVLFLAIMVG